MPEIIDPVFAKTSQNARFLLSENERFGLVFVKTGSINSGTDYFYRQKKHSSFFKLPRAFSPVLHTFLRKLLFIFAKFSYHSQAIRKNAKMMFAKM